MISGIAARLNRTGVKKKNKNNLKTSPDSYEEVAW